MQVTFLQVFPVSFSVGVSHLLARMVSTGSCSSDTRCFSFFFWRGGKRTFFKIIAPLGCVACMHNIMYLPLILFARLLLSPAICYVIIHLLRI